MLTVALVIGEDSLVGVSRDGGRNRGGEGERKEKGEAGREEREGGGVQSLECTLAKYSGALYRPRHSYSECMFTEQHRLTLL